MIGVGCGSPRGGGSGGGSLTVGVFSDAGLTTPITEVNFNQTIYIKSTVTGITATDFRWLISAGGVSDFTLFEQDGGDPTPSVLEYTVNGANDVVIFAEAIDGVAAACALNETTLTSLIDPDAKAYIDTQAGITSDLISRYDAFVKALKAAGIWSKGLFYYPELGGSASNNKYNIFNPVDSDAAYRRTFLGGWTFTPTASIPNGTNAYCRTFFIDSVNGILNDEADVFHSGSDANGFFADMGAGHFPTLCENSLFTRYTGNTYAKIQATNASLPPPIAATASSSDLILIASRTSSLGIEVYINGTQYGQTIASTARVPVETFLSAYNNNGSTILYSPRARWGGGKFRGLTPTEAAALRTAIINLRAGL